MAVISALLTGMAVYVAYGGCAGWLARRRLAKDHPRPPQHVSAVSAVRHVATRRQREATRRAAVIEWCAALTGELQAGRLLEDAVRHASRLSPGAAPRAAAAAENGLDVTAALRADAAEPGAEGLRAVAACVRAASTAGAGLAAATARVQASLRAEQEQRERIGAELAGPRATARLLAGLPMIGLGIGHAVGADPVGVLLGTAWGRGVALVGLALDMAGVWWVGAIASRAERAI